MVFIRAAENKDAEGIYNAHMQSIRKLCARDYTAEEIAAWTSSPKPESYVSAMEAGENMFVAVENGQIAGFTGIKADEICAVYVHPDFAGRGIGSALLERAELHLRENNISKARLHATLTAKPFYLRKGWKTDEETVHHLRCGVKIQCIAMRKDLGKAEV